MRGEETQTIRHQVFVGNTLKESVEKYDEWARRTRSGFARRKEKYILKILHEGISQHIGGLMILHGAIQPNNDHRTRILVEYEIIKEI